MSNSLYFLTSSSTLEKLHKVKQLNPPLGDVLHAQIGKALEQQSSILTQGAELTFGQSPFSVNMETGQVGLKRGAENTLASVKKEALQEIEAIAMKYYEGNLNALLSSSREEIKKRIESRAETDEIAERGLRILDMRAKGKASPRNDVPKFAYGFGREFYILRKKYADVKNIVPSLTRLTVARKKLKMTVPELVANRISEQGITPPRNLPVPIEVSDLPYTQTDPFVLPAGQKLKWIEIVTKLPVGSWVRNPENGHIGRIEEGVFTNGTR